MLVPSPSTSDHVNGNRNLTHCKRGHEFNEENTYISKQGRRMCRTCHRDYERQRIQNSPEATQKNRDRANAWRHQGGNLEHYREYRRDRRAKNKLWLDEKKASGCFACGEKRIECLDFHHKDRKTKSFNIGLNWDSVSRERLEAEVAKCQVLCANCHRFITVVERKIEKGITE